LAQARFGPETVGPPLGEAEAARDPCPRDIMGAASCRPVAEQVSLESLDARSEPPTCKVSAAAAKSDAELGGVRPDLPRLPTPRAYCTQDVPPLDRGGFALMMLLYVVKTLAMLAALMLFVTPTNSILDRAIDTGGTRSMMVYMVHMVFIMEPGESLCMARYVHPEQSGCLSIVLLFILAFAVNVLCSSDFTATLFQPLLEPLATIGCLSTRAGVVWRMVSNKSI